MQFFEIFWWFLNEKVDGESKKKYTRLMSHNSASIASILRIRLGLDS